jgi:hypothetical protein
VENGKAVQADPNSVGGISANTASVAPGSGRSAGIWITSGTLTSGATWGETGMSYVISDGSLTIATDVALTLLPGAVIKFKNGSAYWLAAGIYVNGTLVANGTPNQKVIFTSLFDDSVSGDTNGDGSATTPVAGNWSGFIFNPGSGGSLSNIIVRYASYGVYIQNGASSPLISNSTLSYCTYGLNISGAGANPQITSNTITNNGTGINSANGAAPQIQNNVISNNSVGLSLVTSPALFTGNSFVENGKAVQADPNSVGGISANTASVAPGSGKSAGIWMTSGFVTSSATWSQTGIPYVFDGSYLWVASGKTLTLSAGVVIKHKVGGNGGEIGVQGNLVVNGTPNQQVIFTSLKDDSVCGDTNGDGNATAPASGDWTGFIFDPGSSGSLSNIIVRYAQNGVNIRSGVSSPHIEHSTFSNSGRAISISGSYANPQITYNSISNNSTAIYCQSQAQPLISMCDISGNTAGVVNADTSVLINAKNNYWGASNGPSGAGLGSGDSVSQFVDYNPFLGQSALSSPINEPYLSASPNPVLFGQVPAGTAAGKILVLANTGTATMTITSVRVSGAPFGLQATPAFPITLGPYTSIGIPISFTPPASGVFPGSVIIVSDANSVPTSVAMSGSCGVGSPPAPGLVSISPTSVHQGMTVDSFVVTGSNFDPGATIQFGGSGVAVTSYLLRTQNQIVVALSIDPNAVMGARDVIVANSDLRRAILPAAMSILPGGVISVITLLPNHGGNTGQASVTIVGQGFDQAAVVRLVRQASQIIGVGTTVSSTGSELITTFDLNGSPPGLWDLIVTNSDASSLTMPGAFTIEQGGRIQLWVETVVPQRVFHGNATMIYVTYGNRGTVDATSATLIVTIPVGPVIDPKFGNEFGVVSMGSDGTNTILTVQLDRIPAGSVQVLPLFMTMKQLGTYTIRARIRR